MVKIFNEAPKDVIHRFSGMPLACGGEISGNTTTTTSSSSNSYGGGVFVNSAKFTKTGGIIHGYDAMDSNSNIVKRGSTIQTDRGSAIYATDSSTTKRMENNAEQSVFLLFDGSIPPTWSGDWDF